MAFQTNVTTAPASSNNQSNDQSWRADRFLNLWIKGSDGSRRKLGAIPLKKSKAFEAAIIKRLDEGEDALSALQDVLEMSYNSAEGAADIDVGF